MQAQCRRPKLAIQTRHRHPAPPRACPHPGAHQRAVWQRGIGHHKGVAQLRGRPGKQEREEASGPAAQSNGGAQAPAAPPLLSVSVSMGAARRVLLSYTWYHSNAAPRGKARPPGRVRASEPGRRGTCSPSRALSCSFLTHLASGGGDQCQTEPPTANFPYASPQHAAAWLRKRRVGGWRLLARCSAAQGAGRGQECSTVGTAPLLEAASEHRALRSGAAGRRRREAGGSSRAEWLLRQPVLDEGS